MYDQMPLVCGHYSRRLICLKTENDLVKDQRVSEPVEGTIHPRRELALNEPQQDRPQENLSARRSLDLRAARNLGQVVYLHELRGLLDAPQGNVSKTSQVNFSRPLVRY